jgi:5-methyltetrahydrofolate--homocysteine methyltransferase
MASKFLQALHSNRVLLMDGAMGTEIQRMGISSTECCEAWNLTYPDRILAIHRAYVAAGAEVLLTNTFQANPSALAKHGLEGKLEALCQAAVHAARQACGPQGFVLGVIGPYTGDRHDLDRMVHALEGADGLLVETLSDHQQVEHLGEILALRQRAPELAVLASFTYCRSPDGKLTTVAGLNPEAIARRAAAAGFHGLGVNCGRDISLDDTVAIVRQYRSVSNLLLFARPNAGSPSTAAGKWLYPRMPAEMAAKLPELLAAGVGMVGGCCGTTPDYVAAFKRVVGEWNDVGRSALHARPLSPAGREEKEESGM